MTQDMITQKPSNEKVKLGWGRHPQIFTTLVIKCLMKVTMFDHET